MKHLWCEAYEKKLNETGNEEEAVKWADEAMEREIERLEMLSDAAREQT